MEFVTLEDHIAKEEEKKTQTFPLVNTLMPMKNYFKAQEFMFNVGDLINLPFKTLDCGCLYVEFHDENEHQSWVYISTCPICRIKENIEDHRSHFNFEI